jgi:hypothetical protein
LHNAFAILSQPKAPTIYNMSGPALQMDDDKTIIPPDPQEHRRQRKIAQQQHIKQTLRQLRDSDDLFLDNSITLAEDEWTSLAKDDTNNKKRLAINAAHTKCGTPSIGIAQGGRNAAYSLGSAFNRPIKKINKNKHVSFATHNEVHQYTNNEQPIMVTYNSGADATSARRINAKQAFPFCNHQHERLESPMEAQARLNTSPNSRSNNPLLEQCRQTHSRISLLL